MKVAVIGSRSIRVKDLKKYLPENTTEIVSGGARGVDACAREYAYRNKLILTEFLPEYRKYGKKAPLIRNNLIVDYSDKVFAFWDGKSHGTKYVIDFCKQNNKRLTVYIPKR